MLGGSTARLEENDQSAKVTKYPGKPYLGIIGMAFCGE
jgi:hypothetical protein